MLLSGLDCLPLIKIASIARELNVIFSNDLILSFSGRFVSPEPPSNLFEEN